MNIIGMCNIYYIGQNNIILFAYYLLNNILYIVSRETYIEREPGEKINDRNDRAIRVAVKWYNSHLSSDGYNIKVVLLTDDVENRTRATEDGLFVLPSKIHI